MVAKKTDPGYAQIAGHVPKDLALQFRVALTQRELKLSDGLEAAIRLWLKIETSKERNSADPTEMAIAFFRACVAGQRPKNSDVLELARELDLREEDLIAIRDRLFPRTEKEKTNGGL